MRRGRKGGRRRLLMGSVNVSQPLSPGTSTPTQPASGLEKKLNFPPQKLANFFVKKSIIY